MIALLDTVQTIKNEIDEQNPRIVYTDDYADLNTDHQLACRTTVTATRLSPGNAVTRALAYETLSASECATPNLSNVFQPTFFVDISDQLETKLAALTGYGRELRKFPHARNTEAIRHNAEVWGAKTGLDAAEPFEIFREINTDSAPLTR
jgi:LmbE family N-acetylglucosaminyl deacetylase